MPPYNPRDRAKALAEARAAAKRKKAEEEARRSRMSDAHDRQPAPKPAPAKPSRPIPGRPPRPARAAASTPTKRAAPPPPGLGPTRDERGVLTPYDPLAPRPVKVRKRAPITDWREDPGGGFVETKSGQRVPLIKGDKEPLAERIASDPRYRASDRKLARKYLNAYDKIRKEQHAGFDVAKTAERLRKQDIAVARWAAERKLAAEEADQADQGIWDRVKGTVSSIPGAIAGIPKAVVEEIMTSAWGATKDEHVPWAAEKDFTGALKDSPTMRGIRLASKLYMEFSGFGGAVDPMELGQPGARGMKAAALMGINLGGAQILGRALGGTSVAAKAARAGKAARQTVGDPAALAKAAFLDQLDQVEKFGHVYDVALDGMASLGDEGLHVPLTQLGRGGTHVFEEEAARLEEMFQASRGRAVLDDATHAGLPAAVADAYMHMADVQALSLHQQISKGIADELEVLDAKIADGTITPQEMENWRELGAMKRFGVPVDYYYAHLHEAGVGIPRWVQMRYEAKFPDTEWAFKFEGPARAGENFSEKAIDLRLKAKLNPSAGEKGLQVNPIAKARYGRRTFSVVGPISNEEWLKRVLAVFPDRETRMFWGDWYRTFEPIFREAFGEDADAIMRGFAASQANTSPAGGITVVLRVMDRLRRGEEVTNEGIGMVAQSVKDAIMGTPLESGMAAKLSDFTDALAQLKTRTWMGHKPEGGRPAPSDIWAGRDQGYVDKKMVGYLEKLGLRENVDFVVDSPGAPAGARYERISEKYNEIADWMNKMENGKGFDGHQWTPADVQALGWGAIQKFLGVEPENIMYALERNAYEIATEVTRGPSGIGADLPIERGMALIEYHLDDVRALVDDTPGVYMLPGAGFDITTGGWAQGQNAALQFRVIGEENAIQTLINRLAQAFDQEYVQATRLTSSASAKPRSALVIASDAFEDERAKQTFFEAISENGPKGRNPDTGEKESLLQGYARHADVDGKPAIVIRTWQGTATGKAIDPWVSKFSEAAKKATEATGIKATLGHENMAMLVGGQHGAVDPLASSVGRAGGRATLDDQLAASIRQRLETAARGLSLGAPEEQVALQSAAEGVALRIDEVEKKLDALVRERVQMNGGTQGVFASGGRATGSNREWVPGIGRRGAIGGHAGDYIEPGVQRAASVRRTPYENAYRRAEQELIAEGGEYSRLSDELSELYKEREAGYEDWARFAKSRGQLHGVHAYNGNRMDMHGTPVGMSAVYVSENTPIPTRIWVHEFMGHYIDRQLLPRMPEAKKIIDDLTAGLDVVEKAETIARWWEEYVTGFAERGGNVPESLKPSLQLLSEQALAETRMYSGGASARVYLPPEIADLFDSFHWYEGLTGKEWVPGQTKITDVLEDIDTALLGSVDEGGMALSDAQQTLRLLQLNSKTQQIPGQARSRLSGLIEKLADKVSEAMMGEGNFAAAARRIMPTASAEMRVSKYAGRELHKEAMRAYAAQHSAIAALPKAGSAVDTAHYWYAQLPERMRNVEGLQAVRKQQVSELEYIASGQALDEAEVALEGVKADLKEAEWGTPEWASLAGRQGEIMAYITDLPFRADDLARSIAQVDAAIVKAPPVDAKIIDAMRRLSGERENLLIEAGVLNPERAANRKGLLGKWLGHESDGSEVFVGHRLGKVRGAKSDLVPAALGLGRPRTPEGVGAANDLKLAASGRLRQSTHVVAEDWQASQVYRQALTARRDLGQMGVQYTGGPLPEGYVLVNPKGRIVPKAWKTDRLAGLSEDAVEQIDNAAREIRDSFFADEAHRAALIEAAHEQGIPLTDLRLVKETVAKRYFNQFVRKPVTSRGLRAYDHALDYVGMSIIFGRLGYIPKNVVQNLIMAAPHQGVFFPLNATRAAQLMGDRELWHMVTNEVGGGVAQSLDTEMSIGRKAAGIPHKAAQVSTAVADSPLRVSAWIHEAAKEGIIPKFGAALSEADKVAIHDLLTNPAMRGKLNVISQRATDAMADFDRMTPGQRKLARRFLIIPGWLMAGSRYPIHFAVTHPLRSAAIAYVLAGEPYADRLGLPQNDPIWEHMKTVGFNQGIDLGNDMMLRTTSLNPVSTPWEILNSLINDTDKVNAAGYANPLIPAIYNIAKGASPYGRHVGYAESVKQNLQRVAPNWSFIEGMISPKEGGTYPGDKTRLGRLYRELGILPIKVKPGGYAAKSAADEWQEKVDEARKLGTPIPPNVKMLVQSKGDWAAIQETLGDDATDEEKAKAMFELLVQYVPGNAQYRKIAYEGIEDPTRINAVIADIEDGLGWGNLSEMSEYLNAEKRNRAAKEKKRGS